MLLIYNMRTVLLAIFYQYDDVNLYWNFCIIDLCTDIYIYIYTSNACFVYWFDIFYRMKKFNQSGFLYLYISKFIKYLPMSIPVFCKVSS